MRISPRLASWLPVIPAVLAFAIATSSAQQPPAPLQSYDVELVIFRTLGTGATPEDWALEAATTDRQLTIPDEDQPVAPPIDAAPAAPAADFPVLPASRMKLGGLEDALHRSRNYQPLAHIGWTQPGFPRDAARSLSVTAYVPPGSGLTGQIALSRGRFLHLTLDLAYDASANGDTQTYVIRQTRRMRSNERHYIDHPRFGVIALVTPVAQ